MSAIALGRHKCQVDSSYRFRPCTVLRNSNGELILDTTGGLMSLRGTLRPDGTDMVFEGKPKEAKPFGCTRCIGDDVSETGQIFSPPFGCIPLHRSAFEECLQQRAYIRFMRSNGLWSGHLSWYDYDNKYEYLPDKSDRVVGFTKRKIDILVTIE